jgi:predicted RNase H-like nuclease (RuvC/YqgF family)
MKAKRGKPRQAVRQKHAILPHANDSNIGPLAAAILEKRQSPLAELRERFEREMREKREAEKHDLEMKLLRKQLADAPAAIARLTDEDLKKVKALTHKRAGEELGGITDRTVRDLIAKGSLDKSATGKTLINAKFFAERTRRLGDAAT